MKLTGFWYGICTTLRFDAIPSANPFASLQGQTGNLLGRKTACIQKQCRRLVRHAERAIIVDQRQQAEPLLTDNGKADAQLFGKSIPLWAVELLAIYSPYCRCQQTAEQIVHGAVEVGHNATLGSPVEWLAGDFPDADMDFVAEMIRSKGYPFFLRKWYDEQLPSDRIALSREVALTEMTNLVQYLEDTQFTITLGVTYDWRISILFEYVLGLRFEDVGIPALLDTIAVLVHNGKTILWYQGHSVEVAAKKSNA